MANLTKDTLKPIYTTTLGTDLVTIGDEKSSVFVPQICFTKWGGENTLTIKAPDIFTSVVPTLLTKELSIGDSKNGFYFEPQENGDFKLGIIWKEKPATNSWSAQIIGWEEYNFFLQPPLTQEWKVGDKNGRIATVTDTQCLDKDGKVLVNRPDNVVGSYAIFHKTKRDFIVGVTPNYQIGLFCSVLRPKFVDALDKWVWGTLIIKDGLMTETCPQDFLDSAVYPVRSNATFGYSGTLVGCSTDGVGDNANVALTLTATAPAGTLNHIHIAFTPAGSGGNYFKFACYSNSGTAPSTKLAYDASAWDPGSTAQNYYSNPVDMNYTMTLGATYWGICWGSTGSGNGQFCYFSGTGQIWYNDAGVALPTPFAGQQDIGSVNPCVYFEYTAGGGATATGIMTTRTSFWGDI